jgi:hypothetical protein
VRELVNLVERLSSRDLMTRYQELSALMEVSYLEQNVWIRLILHQLPLPRKSLKRGTLFWSLPMVSTTWWEVANWDFVFASLDFVVETHHIFPRYAPEMDFVVETHHIFSRYAPESFWLSG